MGLKQHCNIVSYRAVENCLKELAGNVIFHSGSELMMINISMDNYNVNPVIVKPQMTELLSSSLIKETTEAKSGLTGWLPSIMVLLI